MTSHKHNYLPEVDGNGLKTGVVSCDCGAWESGHEDEGTYIDGNRITDDSDERGRIIYNDDTGRHECTLHGEVNGNHPSESGSYVYRCAKCGAWTRSGL